MTIERRVRMTPEENHAWVNHHQTVCFTPKRYYDVWNFWEDGTSPEHRRWQPGVSALCQIVRDAEAAGHPVRALGGGWSLSEAVKTNGYLVNTKPLNVIQIGIRANHCSANFLKTGGKPEHLVFSQCGASVAELNAELESNGLSLPTSGASNGQTICGAMSTGTHGAAVDVGSVQDYVVGIDIIAENGKRYWLQRSSAPVVNEEFCAVLETELRTNDRLFNAAVVSFGSFGIIHAVLLKTEPLFLLRRHLKPFDYPDVLPRMSSISALNELACHGPPFHCELLINPYATGHGQEGVIFRHMYKIPPSNAFRWNEKRMAGDATLSNDAFGLIGRIASVLSPAVPAVVTYEFNDQLKYDDGTVLTHGATFDSTKIPGHSVSTELGFALETVPDAVQIIVEEIRRHNYPGIPALRYVKGSCALLAFTKFTPVSCAIEILGVRVASSLATYIRIWERLEKAHIDFTYHWGQFLKWGNDPAASRARIEKVFGERLMMWLDARSEFLSPAGRRLFSGPLLEQCGLSG